MNAFEYYKGCWKKYATFNGRARRAELWYFVLFNWLISIAISIVDTCLFGFSLFGALYGLAALIPGLAVAVRRMHDTGRSGWTLLLGLIPVIGWILLIVFYCQDSLPGNNKWGANPKELEA